MNENDILSTLNDKQKEVAVLSEGTIRVLAGAGTGKTKTMVHRIAYMINVLNINPSEILVFSYTNKAVNEFRERIHNLLGEKVDLVNIHTFHAFANKILKTYTNENFKILADGFIKPEDLYRYKDYAYKTRDEVFKSIRKDDEFTYKNAGFSAKDMMLLFDKIKERKFDINDVEHTFLGNVYLREIYKMYNEKLQKNGLYDFADLLIKLNELLNKKDILKKIREHYKYTIVDEFQDTNDLQLEIINKIIGDDKNLCVVGDDSQSIYAFRGANVNLIIKLGSQFNDLKTINLEQNYRSTKEIIKASNNLIEKNKNKADKIIWTDNIEGNKIIKIKASNKFEEAQFVVEKIQELKASGIKYSDIAILYRNNSQSQIIQERLLRDEVQIPYRVKDPSNFFNRPEIKGLLSYLRLYIDPTDASSFLDCMMKPARYFSKVLLEQIINLAIVKNNGDILKTIKDIKLLKKNTSANKSNIAAIEEISDMYDAISNSLKRNENNILETILTRTNYIKGMSLSFHCMNTPIEELKNNIGTFSEIFLNADIKNSTELEGFMIYINNLDEKAKRLQILDSDKTTDAIQLSTIHSAKGLEFPYVFLIGMVEDVFPNYKLKKIEEDLEEERRLCYVAITRPMKQLYLSTYDILLTPTGLSFVDESRFIKEMEVDMEILESKDFKTSKNELDNLNLDETLIIEN